jgi:hypothetical protein
MGDRANFGFVQPNGNTIVLYGHWAGHNMLGRLADAVIAARGRWNDPSYATRIATSYLIADQWNMETGWGLHVNEIGIRLLSLIVTNRNLVFMSKTTTEIKITKLEA